MKSNLFISTVEEYNLCKEYCEPLINPLFEIEIKLRVQLQYEMFCDSSSRTNIVSANDRFYHFVWNNKGEYCENCFRPLYEYSASFISHILTRGGFAEMSLDPRNTNKLCFLCHAEWESGKNSSMLIYPKNILTIEKLKYEYNILRKGNINS